MEKKDCQCLLFIFVLFLINLFLFKSKMIALYIDFGKEIYFAKAIAQGGVLYKDVLALFGPFAYLLNALFVKLFGAYIKTFYVVGAVNALLILTGIYALSREFLSRVTSFAVTIFVMYFCCFNAHVMNYLTPYSYGVVYGLCAVVYSVLLFVKYLKKQDVRSLYAGMFLAGIAASCKYEFVLPAAVMLVFAAVAVFCSSAAASVKTPASVNAGNCENGADNDNHRGVMFWLLAKSVACFLIVPVACLFVLLFQGISAKELFDYFVLWLNFASGADMKEYYTGTFYFSLPYFTFALKSFAVVIAALAGVYGVFAGMELAAGKIKSGVFSGEEPAAKLATEPAAELATEPAVGKIKPGKFKQTSYLADWITGAALLAVHAIVFLSAVVLLIAGFKFDRIIINFTFCALPMVLATLALIKIKPLIKEKERDLPVLFLAAASLAAGAKVFFFVNVIQYGRYFLPLILLALVVVLKKYYFGGKDPKDLLAVPGFCANSLTPCSDSNSLTPCPDNDSQSQERAKPFDKTLIFFLLFMSVVSFEYNLSCLKVLNHKISSPYGTVYKDEASAKVFNTILDTVNKYTTPDDTVVVLQEGLLINFLSGRKADKYNYLIPSLLNLYGEDNVVNHFSETKPEMFVILTSAEDKALICNGWGYNICGYVSKNYRLVQEIRADKLILIFKKI